MGRGGTGEVPRHTRGPAACWRALGRRLCLLAPREVRLCAIGQIFLALAFTRSATSEQGSGGQNRQRFPCGERQG